MLLKSNEEEEYNQ